MQKLISIGIDMDNTMNNLSESFFSFVKSSGVPYDLSKYTSYNFEDVILLPKEERELLKTEIFKLPEFWLDAPLFDSNVVENVRSLYSKYMVQIITTPYKQTPFFMDLKLEWLQKYFPFISEDAVIFRKDKWNLPIDIMIDDNPEVITNCFNKGIITVAPLHVYNKDMKEVLFFLKDWKEIKSIIKECLPIIL